MYLGRIVEAGTDRGGAPGAAAPLHPGAAVGGARDRAARAGRADRRDPRPDPDPGRLPLPPALPGARRRVGGRGRCRRRLPRPSRWRSCPPDPQGHQVACHLAALRSVDRPADGEPRVSPLQAALPREMYVDPAAWRARARPGAVRRVVLRRAASTTSGLAEPGGSRCVDVVGGVGAGHQRRGRRAARGVQRLPAPRLPAVPGRARRRAACCEARRAALPLPLLDLRPRRPAAAGAARRRGRSTRRTSRCTRSASTEWAGFVFVHLTPESAGPARRRGGRPRPRTWPTTRMGDLVTGRTLTYEVAANYKVLAENYNECYHCGPVHPELTRLVPAFGGGGAGLDWDGRHPAPRGRLDLHHDRHDRPGAAARASTRTSGPGTRASWSTPT